MEQIADAVGIKAPSVYKHYKGKSWYLCICNYGLDFVGRI